MTEYEERMAELSSIICRVCEGNDVLMYAFIFMIMDTAKDSLYPERFHYFIDAVDDKFKEYLQEVET